MVFYKVIIPIGVPWSFLKRRLGDTLKKFSSFSTQSIINIIKGLGRILSGLSVSPDVFSLRRPSEEYSKGTKGS